MSLDNPPLMESIGADEIDAAMKVHSALGRFRPGFPEFRCLAHERWRDKRCRLKPSFVFFRVVRVE
jgi:hypothetical protein